MRAVLRTRHACLALFAITPACLGCAPREHEDVDLRSVAVETSEPPVATKPTGSQDCNLAEPAAIRLSLQETQFSHFLRATDVIPFWFDKDVSAAGTLTLHVVVTSFDAPDAPFDLNRPIAASQMHSAVEVRLADITLPTHTLPVSRHLSVHAIFTVADEERYEAAGSVRLYFHPDGNGWQVYDEAVRDRDYWEGALTEEERAKRQAAMATLPAGTTAEYVNARVTKLSDDPEHIPPDDAADDEVTQ